MTTDSERCLWTNPASIEKSFREAPTETFDSIYARFASTPRRQSFWQICSSSHVVVQEISITSYLLARHRVLVVKANNDRAYAFESSAYTASTVFIVAALMVVLFYGSRVESKQDRNAKIKQRAIDGILSATLLRLMASLLQSLTASYASDTLYSLAVAGLAMHVLACDYSYANGNQFNGKEPKQSDLDASSRLLFQGGTVSLNSALFSTTLLVSRLDRSEAYFFIYFATVLFAFYPVTRNSIASAYPTNDSVALWLITALLCLATCLLLECCRETLLFVTIIAFVGLVLPFWRFVGQRYKVTLHGPWDIPTKIS